MVKEYRLILRGENCTNAVTTDMVKDFFNSLTQTLGMTTWKGPWAWEMKKKGLEPGVSGAVIWHESGCQLHEYKLDKKVTVDIYSCRSLDVKKAEVLFKDFFWPKELTSYVPEI